MDVRTLARPRPPVCAPPAAHPRGRWIVEAHYLVTGGVLLGVVSAAATTYHHVADEGLFAFVREGWLAIVMAHPTVYAVPALMVLVWLASRDLGRSRG